MALITPNQFDLSKEGLPLVDFDAGRFVEQGLGDAALVLMPSNEFEQAERQRRVLRLADDLLLLNKKTRDGGSLETSDEIREISEQLLERESERAGYDVCEDNKFVLVRVDGSDSFADLGRAVEARVFSDKFHRTPQDVNDDYGPYDDASTMLICIDAELKQPAGSIRIVHNSPIGLPDVNVLGFRISQDPSENISGYDRHTGEKIPVNPWHDELDEKYALTRDLSEREIIQQLLFDGGAHDDAERPEDIDVDSILDRTLNVATLSVLRQYARGESIPGPGTLLYNGVVREAKNKGAENLIAIQDVEPFRLLQSFGSPFDELGLEHRKYGGPDPTVPSFCDIRKALPQMEERVPGLAEFITQRNAYKGLGFYLFGFQNSGYWTTPDSHQDLENPIVTPL
jgi:hypothetical protein